MIVQAGRGCHYTLAQLARFACQHNLARSVDRTAVAVCWDKFPIESFWATPKLGLYGRLPTPTRAAVALAVGNWIERDDNLRRPCSTIGMLSPSSSKTGSLSRHKPPGPVSTKRGQAHQVAASEG